jgi:dTDP-D-glucose 4,6-dehydratase
MVEPLLDSLVVDAANIRRKLDWRPPYTMDHGLRETAKWLKNTP